MVEPWSDRGPMPPEQGIHIVRLFGAVVARFGMTAIIFIPEVLHAVGKLRADRPGDQRAEEPVHLLEGHRARRHFFAAQEAGQPPDFKVMQRKAAGRVAIIVVGRRLRRFRAAPSNAAPSPDRSGRQYRSSQRAPDHQARARRRWRGLAPICSKSAKSLALRPSSKVARRRSRMCSIPRRMMRSFHPSQAKSPGAASGSRSKRSTKSSVMERAILPSKVSRASACMSDQRRKPSIRVSEHALEERSVVTVEYRDDNFGSFRSRNRRTADRVWAPWLVATGA